MKYQPPKFTKAEEELSWLFTADTETDYQKLMEAALKSFSPEEAQGFIHWLMAGARFKLEIGETVCEYLKKKGDATTQCSGSQSADRPLDS